MKLRAIRTPDCRARRPTALRMAIASILSGAAAATVMPALAADSDALAEITVTARKQTENLQDVPQSIDVFTSKDIQNLAISQFEDYATRSPSISYISIGPGYQQFFMRGVSDGSNPNVANTSTTGLYLDEQSLSYFGGIPDLHMYDIQRIEVLNGPQGTLYGASSMSGAVKIITNKPDPTGLCRRHRSRWRPNRRRFAEWDCRRICEHSVDQRRCRAAGIGLLLTHQGGFIDNLLTTRNWINGTTSDNSEWAGNNYNHEAMYGGRAAINFKFNDTWSAILSGDYQTQIDARRLGPRSVALRRTQRIALRAGERRAHQPPDVAHRPGRCRDRRSHLCRRLLEQGQHHRQRILRIRAIRANPAE